MMLALPASASSLHPAVATATDLPIGDPAGWLRVVVDELAIYISDGSTYAVYPAPVVPIPFAFSAKKSVPVVQEQNDDEKYDTLSSDMEIMRKSVQGAYDLIASIPVEKPNVQLISEPFDEAKLDSVKAKILEIGQEIEYLFEEHEKHSEQVDEQISKRLEQAQKQIDLLQQVVNDHGMKLANIRQEAPTPQFVSVMHFILWLVTLGYFGTDKTK